MIDHVIHAAEMNRHYARIHLEDIPDGDWAALPKGMNVNPAWLVGHIASSFAMVSAAVGAPFNVPDAWRECFGWGSVAKPARDAYPSGKDLLNTFDAGQNALTDWLKAASPASLAAENPNEHVRPYFPAVGDMVVAILTVHTATHLGQLAAWRVAMGMDLKI